MCNSYSLEKLERELWNAEQDRMVGQWRDAQSLEQDVGQRRPRRALEHALRQYVSLGHGAKVLEARERHERRAVDRALNGERRRILAIRQEREEVREVGRRQQRP